MKAQTLDTAVGEADGEVADEAEAEATVVEDPTSTAKEITPLNLPHVFVVALKVILGRIVEPHPTW